MELSKKYSVVSFVVVLLFSFLSSSYAHLKFDVGGKDGWVLNPSENYTHWAGRLRFQVQDSLVFKYKKGSDSVLVVDEADYKDCNKEKPLKTLDDGSSIFKFETSGPFFFISGQGDKCNKGQKLHIVVMAPRHHHHTDQPLPPAPSPHVWQAPAPAPDQSSAAAAGGPVGFFMGLVVVLGCLFGVVYPSYHLSYVG